MKRTYLCGPISGCTDAEAKDWRELCKTLLPPGSTLDPMDRDYRGRYTDDVAALIVKPDKTDIDSVDVVLVKCGTPSDGTAMEIIYGWERNKWVVLIAPPEMKLSPWRVYHSHKRFATCEEACAWISQL